jgi:hypothetical protein
MNNKNEKDAIDASKLDEILPKYEPLKLNGINLAQNYVSAFNTGMNIYQCVNQLQGYIEWVVKAVNDVVKLWNVQVGESINESKAIVRETTTEQFNTEWTNKQPELIEQVNTLTTNQFNNEKSIFNDELNALNSRIDTFTSLTEGSTTGDAELKDIRVGANGVTYPNAGDAVRGQFSQLKEDLTHYIYKPTLEDNNKFPRAKDGNIEWVEQGMPTDEQTNSAVENWLNEHPEATTTVQDRSLTIDKMVIGTLGYVTPEMFGAVGDGETDDTKAIQTAIDSVKNGYVLFQRSTYCVSKELNITNKNIIFNNCILKRISNCTVLNFDNSNNFKLSDVTITDNGSTYGNMIVGRACENVEIKNVTVNSSSPHTNESIGNWATCLSGNAFHISGLRINNYESGLWADGLHFGYVTNSVVEDFVILSGDDSIAITQHELGGTRFENKVSENVKFVNGVVKSAKASPIRIGFDNSGKHSENEIDKCYHKNILFENIECEGGYFLRVEYLSHDSGALPISDENIKFSNISYKQDRIVNNYPPFFVSQEYSLLNYSFNNCNIDCSFATEEMTQPFCYIASNIENEKSLLTFSDCLFNFGNIGGIVGNKINKVKFKNCNFLSNGKKIISIYGSCEFVESDIINYGEEADYFCNINASENDKTYRLNGCFISKYKQFSNKNEDNHTFLFMDNCYFKTIENALKWYGGNVNYNNIIKGDRKLNSSKDIFLYIPANSSIDYDLSNYAYASLLVISDTVETYEIIIRTDGSIMLPSNKVGEARNMLRNAGVTISVINKILTINNIEDVYKNVFIKCYAQTN